ncbi:stress responsive A/B barrel domain-containing protein [Parachaetomium inaequale]|uniref:Stress responsive A/B barrel domain-containing protein n=1 Tax=Parachaetomium inaequale TaxID=2588326 RepID=A0AAN6PRE4_9PEZI|nr:stress responsive A/B barrel domain-containing protein [Parachaetomium inaequale]
MSLIHVVLFQFKADAKPEAVKAVCEHFLSLRDKCIHPTTKTPYILSLKCGKNNSPEGLQNGMTHGFVLEFASAEDRDYYVATDPAHQEFVKSVGDVVEKPTVLDFSDGVF